MRISKCVAATLTVAAAAALLSLAVAVPANAAAYARTVNAPTMSDGKIQGTANVATNCEGTFGCYSYIKIERLSTMPAVIRPWEYQGGHWASEGQNKVVVPARGCSHYRVVVDTYNDSPSGSVLGINLGRIELTLGNGVKRYHQTFTSPSRYICNWA